jgi:hypothetical protein
MKKREEKLTTYLKQLRYNMILKHFTLLLKTLIQKKAGNDEWAKYVSSWRCGLMGHCHKVPAYV